MTAVSVFERLRSRLNTQIGTANARRAYSPLRHADRPRRIANDAGTKQSVLLRMFAFRPERFCEPIGNAGSPAAFISLFGCAPDSGCRKRA